MTTIINGSSPSITFSDGTTQTSAGVVFVAGTVMLFGQTAAPTGFTKLTTNDNAALRVVSGTASTGGTVNFTTAFASQAVAGTVGTSGSTTATGSVGTTGSTTVSGSVGSTTLSTSQIPAHSHIVGLNAGHPMTTNFGGGAVCSVFGFNPDSVNGCYGYAGIWYGNDTGGNGSHDHSFSGGSHTHTGGSFTGTAHTHTGGTFTGTAINLAVKYVDIIMATKD